jgi:hypothetical protein
LRYVEDSPEKDCRPMPHAFARLTAALASALLLTACAGRDRAWDAREAAPEERCLEAVSGTTGGAGVSILRSTPTEEGTEVLVSVEGVAAPWRCEIGEGGRTVVRLEYTGSGGYL